MLPKDLINKYRDWKESSFAQEKDHFERLAKEGISIPIDPNLSQKEQNIIVNTLNAL